MVWSFPPTTTTRMLSPSGSSHTADLERTRISFPPRASLPTNFVSPYTGGCATSEFSGSRICHASLNPVYWSTSSSRVKRSVVATVRSEGGYNETAPDLESQFFKERIIYLDTVLFPETVKKIIAQMLYLSLQSTKKPMYLYINSTGTTKGDYKYGREGEAIAILDNMNCLKTPVYTLCVGHAWGEAALLLASGRKGHRTALPSSTIMIREPIDRYQGQASSVEIHRKELQITKQCMVEFYARYTGKTKEQLETDIRRPKYFSPTEAVEYGLIDKVLYSRRASRGVAEQKTFAST